MGSKKKQLKIPKTEMPFMAQLLNRNGQKKKGKINKKMGRKFEKKI
jgi:hypothetical protein